MGEINPIDKAVGKRIRTKRNQLRLSQARLAEALGISFQQVQKYESGKNRVSASRLHKLTCILGVEPSYFFEPYSVVRAQSNGVDDLINHLEDPEFRALTNAFIRISDPDLREAIIILLTRIGDYPHTDGLATALSISKLN